MKIKIKWFEDKINIVNGNLYTLIIENRNVLIELYECLNNEFFPKNVILPFKDNELLNVEDTCFYINNLFDLNLNTKKNINALYKKLKGYYYSSLIVEFNEIKEKCEKIVESISLDFDIELEVGSFIKIEDLFKFMNITFKEDYENFKEKFIKYLRILNELNGYKVFFINSFHAFFSNEDIETIIKEVGYYDISLIDIENIQYFEKLDSEILKIIDKDYCQIE